MEQICMQSIKTTENNAFQTENHSSIEGWARPLLIMIPYMIFAGIFQMVSYIILGLDPLNDQFEQTPLQSLVISTFTLLGTFVIIGIFRHSIDKENFRSLGFYSTGIQKELIFGLSLGAFILSLGFVFLILTNKIRWVGIILEPDNFLFGFLLFISVAVGEELFMRGYILSNLMLSMNRMVALLVSSVFFSLMHIFNANFSWISFWNILFAGILLGLPYIYTKSLWLPIALHFSWNFFQGTIFGFNVSGHVTYSLINQTRSVDNLWNGGSFGFEGSILSVVLQVIAIGGLWWYYSNRTKITSEPTTTIDIPFL